MKKTTATRIRLPRLRRRTWIIIGSAVVVVGAAVGIVFGVVLPSTTAEAQTIETTATASLETMEQSVSATGTLTPLVDEDVSFAAAGTVLTVEVAEGTVVSAGQQLATIDTLQLNATLLSAKATLAEAEAQLDGASTSTARAAASASVAVAQTAVDTAQAAMADATLVAPVSGTVTSVGVAVGDSVGSSSGSTGGTTGSGAVSTGSTDGSAAFHITGTDAWEVDVTLGEADVLLVAKDDQVELSTDDGTEFFGTVASIGLVPDTSSGTAAYPVTIAVTGTADGLFDGVSTTARIVYERRTEVLTVPSAAVTTASDGTSTVTLIAADGTKTETAVTVGETSDNLTEITDGLAVGDEVLVASFTPGSGNQGTGGFPGGDGTFPTDGTFPGGGTPPDGFTPPSGTAPGQ